MIREIHSSGKAGWFFVIATLFIFCSFVCFLGKATSAEKGTFKIWSPAFEYGDKIPSKYTCDGVNVSPPLIWENPPANTSYYTLLVNDPDAPAGNWIHWNVTYIPGHFKKLNEGVLTKSELPNGIKQGKNTWGTIGYRGPCPPGGTHRYFFTLKAFDKNGQELGKAVLMGKYR